MRKIWVVAVREYMAAVRTKAFVIGLLLMPILMGASSLVQYLLADVVDVSDKRFVVVDRTAKSEVAPLIQKSAEDRKTTDDRSGEQVKPRFLVEIKPPESDAAAQRLGLSDRVRKGELLGFLEIVGDPDAPPVEGKPPLKLVYYTDRPTYPDFAQLANAAAMQRVRKSITDKRGLADAEAKALLTPTELDSKGLVSKDASGAITDASDQSRAAALGVPIGLMMLMFVVILMGATPLMQGVIEEKMQRIAEVLLGSVRPFELMMGKLLGMTGVTLTISAVYLSGAFWAAHRFGFAEYLGADIMVWFLVFQTLGALMFGSLFIAVGAACTDMKEAQNLIWPVTLLAALPMFLLGSIIREPNSPVALGMSFFPFATPSLMLARMGVPPGIPVWQPLLGVVLVLATTLLCVWAAGRIFRIGILLQGKGARMGDILRWVFRG
jgi:ABC-2 type transport system permease protein